MSTRLRLDVVHDEIDAREMAKLGRRMSAAELHATIADRKAREEAQVAAVAAAMTPPRPTASKGPVERPASSAPGEGVTTSRTATPAVRVVRSGGSPAAGSSAPAPLPTLQIPPGAEQWRHVPKDGWVLSGDERAKVERLLAAEARRAETEK